MFVLVTNSAPNGSQRGVPLDAAMRYLDLLDSGTLTTVDQVMQAYNDLHANSEFIPFATACLVLTSDEIVVGMDRVAEAMRPVRGFDPNAFDRLNNRGKH
jgi:hypothetical protein